MNFLVDAHLPRRLAFRLKEAGHDVVHTLDLPNKNSTTDNEINDISEREQRSLSPKTQTLLIHFLWYENHSSCC